MGKRNIFLYFENIAGKQTHSYQSQYPKYSKRHGTQIMIKVS